MAEHIARDRLGKRGLRWTAGSAGLYALEGMPMARHAEQALQRLHVTPQPHASVQISQALMDEADKVLAMTSAQAWDLRAAYPQAFNKIHELGVYATTGTNALTVSCDIVDPFGGTLHEYVGCAEALDAYIGLVIDKLQEEAT